MQAISAVDIALWDLKARVLDVSLAALFGRARDTVPVYGSGGFTTLTDTELADQVNDWAAAGCTAMKIKIGQSWGTEIDRDIARVNTFRDLAGPGRGADGRRQRRLHRGSGPPRRRHPGPARRGVVRGTRVQRRPHRPRRRARRRCDCDVAAGEYAADLYDVARLCPVVDCLQLDVTRCGGYTGWLRGAAVAQAHNLHDLRALRPRPARPRGRRRAEPAARRVVHRPRPPRTAPRRRRTHRPARRPAAR